MSNKNYFAMLNGTIYADIKAQIMEFCQSIGIDFIEKVFFS